MYSCLALALPVGDILSVWISGAKTEQGAMPGKMRNVSKTDVRLNV
jgi:hypothetical protein